MPYQFNPFTGNLDIAGGDATAVALNLKGTVANQAALPSSGNTVGDVWQTADLKKFYVWDGSAWDDLGTLAGPPGDDGREVELQANATHIQWRYVGDATWTNLVALSVITGPPGPGTDISYDAASREVRSSTGADATLPLVTSSAAGLAPASGGGTSNFLRADGTWADPGGGGGGGGGGGTDLSYDASTRLLESSSGSDVTLPLVTLANAGLASPTSYTALTYAATTDLDMAALDGHVRTITLTGNITFTSSNEANGRRAVIRLLPGASSRTLTFPTDWVFISTKPTTLAANKSAVLSLTFFGSTDADCIAAYSVQP